MSNTHQFKRGDRVRVGAPVSEDDWESSAYVKEGAIGIVNDITETGGLFVQFAAGDPLITKCIDWSWIVDPRRLTLVDEKPVEPAAPLTDGSDGPAFPVPVAQPFGDGWMAIGGLTLRQYAAIKLCVPDSGTPWLDEMIQQSLKDRFAGHALAGIMPSDGRPDGDNNKAQWADELATAMMEMRAK